MLVVYHGVDLDGYACAAVANFFYEYSILKEEPSIKFHPINHGEPFPFNKIRVGEKVLILDFPPPAPGNGWERLLSLTKDIIWIDHHESNFEKFEGIEIAGKRVKTYPAACELTWEYFANLSNEDDPKVTWFNETPKVIKMISDHDSWAHNIRHSDACCLGILSIDNIEDPESPDWYKKIFDLRGGRKEEEFIKECIRKGFTIQQYLKKSHAAYVKGLSYEAEWMGYNCLICNRGYTGSFLFDSLWDEDKHDLMIAWVYDGEKYIVSIYTTKTDKVKANDIAKMMGGGGHPGAAGFTCNELPFPGRFVHYVGDPAPGDDDYLGV